MHSRKHLFKLGRGEFQRKETTGSEERERGVVLVPGLLMAVRSC